MKSRSFHENSFLIFLIYTVAFIYAAVYFFYNKDNIKMTTLNISGNNVYGKMRENQLKSIEILKEELKKPASEQDVHKIIKLCRVALGLTQSDFAKIVEVESFSVSRWEKGIYSPKFSIQQFNALRKALNSIQINIFDIGGIMVVSNPPELQNLILNFN